MKLTLNRETVRQLTGAELSEVAGGFVDRVKIMQTSNGGCISDNGDPYSGCVSVCLDFGCGSGGYTDCDCTAQTYNTCVYSCDC